MIHQIMVSFSDIEPFLGEPTNFSPKLASKAIIHAKDRQKQATLLIELAAVVGYGEAFVRAAYCLERHGLLALSSYRAHSKCEGYVETS